VFSTKQVETLLWQKKGFNLIPKKGFKNNPKNFFFSNFQIEADFQNLTLKMFLIIFCLFSG